MVTNVTNLSRSGLRDWVLQRASAVILAVYVLFLLGFFLCHSELSYEQWQGLFANNAMRIFSLLALVSLCAHAWVGLWTITTDYLITLSFGKYALIVRFLVQAACGITTFVFFVWGVQVLWSI